MHFTLLQIYLLIHFNAAVYSSSILFFHLAASSSHRNSIWPLAEKLADKGHNLTYIIALPPEKRLGSHPNIEEISPQNMVEMGSRFFNDFDVNFKLNNSAYKRAGEIILEVCVAMCEAFYESYEIKEWIQRPGLNYDLVLIDGTFGECGYPLVHKFKAKHILFSPTVPPISWDIIGIAPESSIPPTVSLFTVKPQKPDNMDFIARAASTLDFILFRAIHIIYLSQLDKMLKARTNFTDLPDLLEIERNTSLILVNAHFVEEYPAALPPFVQSYSGLSCSKHVLKKRKALPKRLETFLSGNDTDGFVYMSLGSVVDVSTMPVEHRNKFFSAFREFPRLKFLWRWAGEIPEHVPQNLWLQNWFPQQDLMADNRIRGFVTQAGRPSTQEALCYGVPMIAFPISGDQEHNADRLELIGGAINLDMSNMTKHDFTSAIHEVVYTKKYKSQMTKLSALYRDRPIDPLDHALYWTEFVLRHDTALLKPLGLNQTWYQRRLLDVYFVVGGVVLTLILLILGLIFICARFVATLVLTSVGARKSKVD